MLLNRAETGDARRAIAITAYCTEKIFFAYAYVIRQAHVQVKPHLLNQHQYSKMRPERKLLAAFKARKGF